MNEPFDIVSPIHNKEWEPKNIIIVFYDQHNSD